MKKIESVNGIGIDGKTHSYSIRECGLFGMELGRIQSDSPCPQLLAAQKEIVLRVNTYPDLVEQLEKCSNALLWAAQEAEQRAGVPKPIIGGMRHHAAQASAILAQAQQVKD